MAFHLYLTLPFELAFSIYSSTLALQGASPFVDYLLLSLASSSLQTGIAIILLLQSYNEEDIVIIFSIIFSISCFCLPSFILDTRSIKTYSNKIFGAFGNSGNTLIVPKVFFWSSDQASRSP
jgi:hypothetical protein